MDHKVTMEEGDNSHGQLGQEFVSCSPSEAQFKTPVKQRDSILTNVSAHIELISCGRVTDPEKYGQQSTLIKWGK